MFTEFDQSVKNIQTHFEEEIKKLRTGRAHTSLVSDITVDAYGARTQLSGLASINVSDARTIIIEPWDASIVKDIEKALVVADIHMSPVVDGKTIRLHLPDLTQESRAQLVKVIKEKLEDSRIVIRRTREEVKKNIEKGAKAGDLTEDDRREHITTLDAKTRDAIQLLESKAEHKEKEVTTL